MMTSCVTIASEGLSSLIALFTVYHHCKFVVFRRVHRHCRFCVVQRTGSPCTALAFTLRRKTEYLVAMSDYSLKCFDTGEIHCSIRHSCCISLLMWLARLPEKKETSVCAQSSLYYISSINITLRLKRT